MNELTELLQQTTHRIFADLCTTEQVKQAEQGQWASALWESLEENGVTRALLPADRGGSDLALSDGVALLKVSGYYASPLPLAEHWLAGLALADAALPMPEGALSVVPGATSVANAIGTHKGVPWGRRLPVVALGGSEAKPRLKVYEHPVVVKESVNIAGEPRDELDLARSECQFDAASSMGAMRWLSLGALMRSAQMAGALRRCFELSSEYAVERKQFGRPLIAFQAIQQELAILAGEVAAVEAAVDAAANAAQNFSNSPEDDGLFDIAVAKARASMAVESATRISHQIHGAMGFTYEHRLHQYTRRLWSWRDEFGTEVYWNTLIGKKALELGGAGLWPFMTRLGGRAPA